MVKSFYLTSFIIIAGFLSIAQEAYAQCTPVPQVESVINGNFEKGYIASGPGSFATTHTYTSVPQASPFGYYTVGSGRLSYVVVGTPIASSSLVHPWNEIVDGDHTPGLSGNGNALWIDGAGVAGLGALAWQQTVTTIPNQIYNFSAWFTLATTDSRGANSPRIRFVVEAFDASNNPIGGVNQLDVSEAVAAENGVWEQKDAQWTAPIGAVTTRISIYNQSGIVSGNDFGIDDISFINSCSALTSSTLPPTPDMGPDINFCVNASGSITLNSNVATAAGAGRQFTWYSGTGNPQTEVVAASTSANTYTVTTPGTYRVCVYQPSGCAKSSTIVISTTASASGSDINFCSDNQLVATIAPTGVATYLTYVWTKNGSAWTGTNNSTTATADGAGTYLLTGTHSNGKAGCNVTKSFTVTANSATLSSSIGPGPYNLCNPATQGLTSSLTGTGFTYQWTQGGTSISGATASSYTVNTAGTYAVVINFHKAGCANITSNNVVVTSSNAITPADGTFCPTGTPVNPTLSVTPVVANAYRWYDSDGTTIIAAPGAGTSSYTPTGLAASKTYYVEDARSTPATLTTAASGSGGNNPSTLTFNLSAPLTINSITVRRGGQWAGTMNLTIRLYNSSGVLLATSSAVTEADGTTPTVAKVAIFGGGAGITIPAGSGYYLNTSVTPGAMATFAAPSGSGVSGAVVTGGGGQIYSNWSVAVPNNTCSKVPVRATMNCSLPVDFVSFTVEKSGSGALVSWSTAREESNSHFEVESSLDGVYFTSLSQANAVGNSNKLNHYSYLDQRALAGVVYFRVTQVDFNGDKSHTAIRSVNFGSAETSVLVVKPNPNNGHFVIDVTTPGNQVVKVEILNALGTKVWQESFDSEGFTSHAIDLGNNFAKGVYFIKVAGLTQKIIIE